MKRAEIREHIFKILFRVEFHDSVEFEQQIALYMQNLREGTKEEKGIDVSEQDYNYIHDKAVAIKNNIEDIDAKINEISSGWPTTRLGKAELSIMRLAVYEIIYDEDIPRNVAINEAVELAKKYGSDSAPSFINGVLAKLDN
ncbi:transcription antitermination factor NusB [Lachnospira multipara]|uniref:transcription antitermination factor NusB n=1 Tax=Lachnospira multipara TaxID=28051 RepID=UPI00048A2436